MRATSIRTENLQTFLDMDVERELLEHDLTRMLKVAGRHWDFEGNSLSGKKLREEIAAFLISNFDAQRVQLREV